MCLNHFSRILLVLGFAMIGSSAWSADQKTLNEAKKSAKEAREFNQTDRAIEANRQILTLALSDKDDKLINETYDNLLELMGKKCDLEGLKKLLNEMAKDKNVGAGRHFEAQIILTGIKSAESDKTVTSEEIQPLVKDYHKEGMTGQDQLKALQRAASSFIRTKDEKTARAFLAMADAMIAKPVQKIYVCSFMEKVPPGAGGWLLSPLLQDEKLRENRFTPYDSKAAADLITDVNIERTVSETKSKELEYYLQNTAFYSVYDTKGWHIFVKSGEPNIEKILSETLNPNVYSPFTQYSKAEGGKAGSLEMYFMPGLKNETYYQWMIDPAKGSEPTIVDWSSPYRGFRSLKPYFKTETVAYEKAWGTYVFIPWEALYDKLPFDRGEKNDWRFGFIRFSPAGGMTWGGQVHETGKWGLFKWDKPTSPQLAEIKRNILVKAWTKYQRDRTALQTFWQDKVMGDADFYTKALKPEIDRLDKLGESMKTIRDLKDEDVNSLYQQVTSDWMEFDYVVSDLRREYLEKKIVM